MDPRNYSFYQVLKNNAETLGDSPAYITAQKTISHEQFLTQVDSLAAGFNSKGIAKGDRVCILAQNSIEFMEIFGACAKTGAVAYPINWRLSAAEVQGVIELAEPKMLIVGAGHLPQLEETNLENMKTRVLLGEGSVDGYLAFTDLYQSSGDQEHDIDSQDPLAIISTAAVEGMPRGAVLTHENFCLVGDQFVDTFKLTKEDRFLAVLPLFHITGLNMVIGVSQAGGASVIMETFDPALGAKMMDDYQVSLLGTFPPMLEMLLGAKEETGANWSKLRYCFGILNPPEVIQKFLVEVGAEYWTGYGQTETTGIVTLINVAEKPGSAGKVIPVLQIRCVNDSDEDVPVGEPGEIVVNGPLVFKGYWRDEDATQFAFRNGWHHTGDLGKLDEEGYLYYVGRKPEKELIKSGGENIYPAEVEQVIKNMPEVNAVCVIGVPDEKWGETVKAVVELASGKSMEAQAVIDHVANTIASYKKPHHVEFVERLPRLENGDVDREAVKSL